METFRHAVLLANVFGVMIYAIVTIVMAPADAHRAIQTAREPEAASTIADRRVG